MSERRPAHVLFVEDQSSDARLVAEMLQDHGRRQFALEACHTLEAAKARLDGVGDYDLVLLDLNLPDSDGLDTFRALRMHARNLPIVVLTMLEDQDLAISALSEGAQDYLVKNDLSGPRLLTSLRYAMERHAVYMQLRRERDALGREVAAVLPAAQPAGPEFSVRELRDALESEQERSGRLVELERLRRDFMSVIAHDLRSPMQAISAYAELLVRRWDVLLDEKRQHYVRVMNRSSRALQVLLENVLHYGRMEEGAFSYEPAPVELGPLLRLAAQMLAVDDGRILVEVDPDLPHALADERRVLQVVMNLLSNALKFSPPDAPVSVRATAQGGFVQVEIADVGPGIAPADQERLFRKFARAEGSRLVPGVGLGLYICRTMVEAQGGRIWLDSAPGRGTRVRFTLPEAVTEVPLAH